MREICVGRDEEDLARWGTESTGFIAKHYVRTGDEINLSGNILMDVARPHMMLVCGKRGTGKSYTLGTMAEEISFLPEKTRKNLAVLIFDTMGIFWTMKFPNTRDAELLSEWDLEPKGIECNLATPYAHFESFRKAGVPADTPFAFRLSELNANDLCMAFGLDLYGPQGVLIERAMKNLHEDKGEFGLPDLLDKIGTDPSADPTTRGSVENRLLAAEDWGIFHEQGTPLSKIVQGGKVNIIDMSPYSSAVQGWSIRSLVIGLLVKKIFLARTFSRRTEELRTLEASKHPILPPSEYKAEMPMCWFVIDEAHEVLPLHGTTPATEPLLQVIREGRQPGLTLTLATQQPGKIHSDVITQSDMVLSHRVTAAMDVTALNQIMSNYMTYTIEKYLDSLPRVRGSAIILDDNSEKVYAVRVRPRLSWHGGASASLILAESVKK